MMHFSTRSFYTVGSLPGLGKLLLLFCVLFSMSGNAVNTPAEKAKADFKKVNDLYSSTTSYSLDIQYSVYDSHTGGNLVEQKSGKYIKYQGMSYSKVLEIETVVNPKRTVVVNHEDKFIVITDTRKMSLSPLQTNVDSLLKWCSSIQVQDLGTTERHYTLNFTDDDQMEFSKIELHINLSNYSIKKMVLCYNQEMPLNQNDYYEKEKKPRLEIVYKTFVASPPVNVALFAEDTYVTQENNAYKGKGKTITYEVINQLQSVRFKKK